MRVFLLLVACAGVAHADPEGTIRDAATPISTKRITLGFDTGVAMRSDGTASVGIGLASHLALGGDYDLALGLMYWDSIDDDDDRSSWETSIKLTRRFRVAKHVAGHVVSGLDYERVTFGDDGTHGRIGALVGAGLSWKITERVMAWTELQLASRRWLDNPPGTDRSNEFVLMVMFGFTF